MRGAVQKQKNCPNIVVSAEAGIQEKQSLMDVRFRGRMALNGGFGTAPYRGL